jgi:SAM-dependent methyltransferase
VADYNTAGKRGSSRSLEPLISYSGDSQASHVSFDLALFRQLNEEFRTTPVVAAPRQHDIAYTSDIGRKRGEMLDRKFGISALRVLELGCGDGMLSRALAKHFGCEVIGVDVQSYDSWLLPAEGNVSQLVHDVASADNAALGVFDRVVSFAVLEHVVHPHAALKAVFDLLKPGGRAYIYASLYRGAKASHRYREVFFPWPHLLFPASVWREFYQAELGEPMQAAWVNKLTYDQYVAMCGRIGFNIVEHFPSAPYFHKDFYQRFAFELSAYPKFDLMHDFIHLVLEKPGGTAGGSAGNPAAASDEPRKVLGAGFTADESPDHAAAKRPEIAEIRAQLASRPLRLYDRINYVDAGAHDIKSILKGDTYTMLGFEFRLGDAKDWSNQSLPRSKQLMLHSWDPLEPLLEEHSATGNPELLAFACAFVSSLIEFDRGRSLLKLDHAFGSDDGLAGSDTAVASRFYRLAYMLAASAGETAINDELFHRLFVSLIEHGERLADESIFSPHSNHGLLLALGQFCGSSRFRGVNVSGADSMLSGGEFEAWIEQATKRLLTVVWDQFSVEGVHREHSPGYHLMLARSVAWVADQSLLDEPPLHELASAIRTSASWMIDPNGHIANLGDTDRKPSMAREVMEPAVLLSPENKLFPDAGYWFLRGKAGNGSTYLAQSCAFHSRVHKQADSGTFIWHDRGRDILIDAGRYGYAGRTEPGTALFRDGFWYSDSKRVYVESTRAHNTIEIDGKNHRRYRQAPTGGTITGVVEEQGVFASRCVVPNAGPGQHQRFVVTKPGEWLAVFDTCRFSDGPHTVKQWFHVHPDWKVEAQKGRWLMRQGNETISVIPATEAIIPSPVISGQAHVSESEPDPGLLGWWSTGPGVFEPCSTICCSKTGIFETFATLFVFGDISKDACKFVTNITHRSIKLNWRNRKLAHSLTLTSAGFTNSEFSIAYAES